MIELTYPGKTPREEILQKKMPPYTEKDVTSDFGLEPQPSPSTTYYLGENNLVLRRLLTELSGKVQLIYIDPPFGTNQHFHLDPKNGAKTISRPNKGVLGYSDTLTGPAFIEFLRTRIILMYELLSPSGLFFLHIGEDYGFHLKLVLDEIFGGKHFISCIARIKSNPKNFSRKAPGNVKDLIFIYSKTRNYVWNDVRIPHTEEDIRRLFPKVDPKTGRRYTTHPLHAPGETQNGETGRPWRGIPPPPGRHWRYPPSVLDDLDRQGLIEWSKTGVPRKKVYADEQTQKGKKLQDIWEFKDPPNPSYPTQKNLDLLRLIVRLGSNTGDLVLDAFAGSGTTLLAAAELNRRSIGIDQSEEALRAYLRRLQKRGELVRESVRILQVRATNEIAQEFLMTSE